MSNGALLPGQFKFIHQVTPKNSSLVSESDTKCYDFVTSISGLIGENVQVTLLSHWIAQLSAYKY